MKKSILLSLVIVTSGLVSAQSPEDLRRLEEFKRRVNMPVVLSQTKKFEGKVTKDIVYAGSADGYKKLDIYQPSGSVGKKLPLVIFIHGKTPIETNPKNWGGYMSWGELAANNEYVSVTLTHSLAMPGKSIEEAGKDLLTALAYVKSKHAQYNVDTNKVALVAYSAGVPLLSVVALQKVQGVKCLVGFYGFMDMKNIEMWKSENDKTLAKFSLSSYVKSLPPIFIARAGREHNVGLNETIDSFTSQSATNNTAITMLNHPTGVHGFDTQNDDDRSREILESMLVFLRYHLR